MVLTVRESQGILRSQGKSGKNQRIRKSQEIQKYQGAKVKKDAEKMLSCCMQTVYNSSKFFLLALLADYYITVTFVLSPLWLQAIEN